MSEHELDRSLGSMTNFTSLEAPAYPGNTEPTGVTLLILGCCLCSVTVLLNLLLAASLIAGKIYSSFTVCVFHMLALDVAVGACVFPLSVSSEYHGGVWRYGDIVCDFWMTLDHFLCILIFVTCSVINVERLLQLRRPTYRLWRETWSWRHFLLIWIPWGFALVVGVPLYVVGNQLNGNAVGASESKICSSQLQQPIYLIFTVVMFLLPLLIVVVTLFAAVVCSCLAACKSNKGDLDGGNTSPTIALALVTMSLVLMMLPTVLVSFLSIMVPNSGISGISPLAHLTLYWIGFSGSAVRPLCWLVDPEIRAGYAALFRQCRCRKSQSVPLHGASLNKA